MRLITNEAVPSTRIATTTVASSSNPCVSCRIPNATVSAAAAIRWTRARRRLNSVPWVRLRIESETAMTTSGSRIMRM
jgi:hypothetical protein